ncbi:MAG: hypothetical protein RR550_00180 [Rikenellaceae bacterium]
MQKQYHKQGDKITLSDNTTLTIEVRKGKIGCKDCYYYKTVDCFDGLCNFDERADSENVIFKRNE